MSNYAKLGSGVFVGPFAVLAASSVEDHASILPYTLLGAKAHIGSFTWISSHCCISSDAFIGSGCLIGTGAKIMAGVRIGNRCRIASNAVVRKDAPDDSLIAIDGRTRSLAPALS